MRKRSMKYSVISTEYRVHTYLRVEPWQNPNRMTSSVVLSRKNPSGGVANHMVELVWNEGKEALEGTNHLTAFFLLEDTTGKVRGRHLCGGNQDG